MLLSVTANTSPLARVSSTSSLASTIEVDSGLSQMTSTPASRNALATGKMEMVGSDDHDGLDAVGPRRLARGHLAEVGVDAIGREAEIGAGGAGVVRHRRTKRRP